MTEQGQGIGVIATEKRVVVMYAPDELREALPVGSVVLKIDGKDARKLLAARSRATWQAGGYFSSPQRVAFFEYRLPLRGARGETHTVQIRVGKRKKRKVVLRANRELSGWLHKLPFPNGAGRGGQVRAALPARERIRLRLPAADRR